MSETPKDPSDLTCREFQDLMTELIAAGEDASQHPHAQNCALCTALLADLQAIADAARELFPIEDPPDHLWEHIQSAIREEDAAKSK